MRASQQVVLLALVAWTLPAARAAPQRGGPKATYEEAARVGHIEQTLGAVRSTTPQGRDQAYHYASAMERGSCSAQLERLRVECLMSSARRFCRSRKVAPDAKQCALTMDVVIANVLAERQLVTAEQRYELMRKHKDFRPQLARHVLRLQGSLAVDFRLATGELDDPRELPAAVDRYCRTTADVSNLTYQTCVASLVWFIGRFP